MATTGSSFPAPLCEYFGVFSQFFWSVVWADCEYGREAELQLLASHCLEGDFEVERADRYDGVSLPWVHESLLGYMDIRYTTPGDDDIRVRVGNVVTHCKDPLRLSVCECVWEICL